MATRQYGIQDPTQKNPFLIGVFMHPDGLLSYDPTGTSPVPDSIITQANQWFQQNGQAMATNYGTIIGNNNNNATNNYYNSFAPVLSTQAAVNPAHTKPANAVSAYGGYWYDAAGQRVGGDGTVPNYNLRPTTAVSNTYGTTPNQPSLSAYGTPTGTQYTQMSGSAYGTGAGTAYTGGTNNPPPGGFTTTLGTAARFITDRAEAAMVAASQRDAALRSFDQLYGASGATGSLDPNLIATQRGYLENSWRQIIDNINQANNFQGYNYIPAGGAFQPPQVSTSVTGSIINPTSAPSYTGWGIDGGSGTGGSGPSGVQTFSGQGGYSGISSHLSNAVYQNGVPINSTWNYGPVANPGVMPF